MTADVLVVGSGASGVHFARAALKEGRRVTMLDVGLSKPEPVLPDAGFSELKEKLPDPSDYFLGGKNEALILPDNEEEYYGFPPSKEFVFSDPRPEAVKSSGFAPLFSYARGGLAEAWTGGSYPFLDSELESYPFGWAELERHYEAVAADIGISGERDDMVRSFPFHAHIAQPVDLDEHGKALMAAYDRHRAVFARQGFIMGRARLAVLTKDRGSRRACTRLGRCLWGCPTGALYTPSWTLLELLEHDNFDYIPDVKVRHFVLSGEHTTGVVGTDVNTGASREFACDRLVLAAGTLESARIFLRSLAVDGQSPPVLTGLMDNRQLLMPFVNLSQMGRPWNPENYQYHQLAMGLESGAPMDYVHGLVTTLKSALIHPVVQNLPFSLATSARFFREMHAALGLVNINFSDSPRPGNQVALEKTADGDRLLVHYEPAADEKRRVAVAAARFRKALKKLGCLAPRGMTHLRPMGASVHYAGTLPMVAEGGPWTLTPEGRSRSIDNLYFVDGTGLPSLPAKNLTFTLMANARRIAEVAFS